ncbi:protease complex subunit PrcB family protein [Alkaliphilus serpentinus]|uniref:Protease complex subunit PrcB family protein n=1 Tax=Alkaliphilus serpentinus TaxID=1482731 RepID=A0A833HRS2_9FIRM|nr:protease complex subunit PrcB family protein [Alkaliphilus serpentinus]KAB3533549.1 protease complex subunit PrcB family protein [Alkaliphilus serpentinus]
MKGKMRIPKFPSINWKLLLTVFIIIILVIVVVKTVPKFFSGNDEVAFVVVEGEDIPEKIQQIMPRYRMLERALAVKIDDVVYVVVTRGEKLTAGYTVAIESMRLTTENDETKLVVNAVFGDPKPDELVAQVITYPYVVAKTNLEELPQKISLEVRYQE